MDKKVSMSHLRFSRYQHNVLLSSYLDSWDVINFKIFLESTSKATTDREKKEGKTNVQKYEYLENGKSFLSEIKNIFHSFWRVIICWKIEIW